VHFLKGLDELTTTDAEASYALKDPEEVQRRHALLTASHIQPLCEYQRVLREAMGSGFEMPQFDLCDGGIQAQALFLLEAPGPKAVGSGFVSRNNPDPTARNMNELLDEARIPRGQSLLWNVVPWYVGSGSKIRPVSASDLREAVPWLKQLLQLLPRLKVIVLMGRKAQGVSDVVRGLSDVPVLQAFHPSNLSLNRHPERRGEVLSVFQEATNILDD
jgi:uracil-DNA glycosylase